MCACVNSVEESDYTLTRCKLLFRYNRQSLVRLIGVSVIQGTRAATYPRHGAINQRWIVNRPKRTENDALNNWIEALISHIASENRQWFINNWNRLTLAVLRKYSPPKQTLPATCLVDLSLSLCIVGLGVPSSRHTKMAAWKLLENTWIPRNYRFVYCIIYRIVLSHIYVAYEPKHLNIRALECLNNRISRRLHGWLVNRASQNLRAWIIECFRIQIYRRSNASNFDAQIIEGFETTSITRTRVFCKS